MHILPINMPDAPDLDLLKIEPQRELQAANHLLDDHAALMEFHDTQGYLLLRQVIDPGSIAKARKAMFLVMERHGLIAPSAVEPIWAGGRFDRGMEESGEFAGIARSLIEHPDNLALMEKLLGEPACMVPIVQYRAYQPGGPITGAHQDGFFSPGILNYKPVWVPLCACEREVGGLMLAVGQNHRGYFHNLAKPPLSPIPEGVIPRDSWATTDYYPGDVLILHPATPHASRPNTSTRCRVTLDTRVQSAVAPRILLGTVTAVTPDTITVCTDHLGEKTFRVDEKTFIRVLHPGQRIGLQDYPKVTQPGMRLVVVFDGDHAKTLRKTSDG